MNQYFFFLIDRAIFLKKLIQNFFQFINVQGKIYAVLNARCPVVHFLLKYLSKTHKNQLLVLCCELSIMNMLGEKKTNFIKSVIDADLSGK